MRISRSRMLRASSRLNSYEPQPCIALVIGRFLANVRKSPIGGTPGGIIGASASATSGSNGASSGVIRTVSSSFRKPKSLMRTLAFLNPKSPGGYVRPPTPAPGHPVRGSSTGRPVMAALDLLGRRWALRVLWELSHEPMRALELKDRCDDMSSSVLYQRLRELSEAGLVIQ